DDSHYRKPALTAESHSDPLPYGVFARPGDLRHNLVDNHYSGGILLVLFGEDAARQQPCAHRAEVIRADRAGDGHWDFVGRRFWATFDQIQIRPPWER